MVDNELTAAPLNARSGGISTLLQARGMYLGYYMAIGSLMPFINLYYKRLGLSGEQIGVLAALLVLVTASTAMIWSAIADAYRLHRTILRVALVVAPLMVLALAQAKSFGVLVALVAVYALFFAPVLPLIDSAAIEVAKQHQRSYGDMRVWGTIGWSISTWLIGMLIDNRGIKFAFYGYAAFMAMTLVFSLFQQPREAVLSTPMRHGLRELLTSPGLLTFLFAMFLGSTTTSSVTQYRAIFLDRIGGTESIIGLAASLAALSEIPIMFASRAMIKRMGAHGMLIMAFLVYSVRWLLLSFVTTPTLALMTELLHGLSFAAFLTGGVAYMHEHTPQGLGTTSQALFTSVVFGLASMTGSLLGGVLYERIGFPNLFRLMSLIAMLGFLIFFFSQRHSHEPRSGHTHHG